MAILTSLLIAGLIGLVGAAASAGTSIYNTNKNVEMNRENNQFNADQAAIQRDFTANEAQKARDFEKMMSDTAIQRKVDDAKAAGFNANSLLAGITGASSPMASNAQGFAAQSSSFAGAHIKADLSGLSYLANTAAKVNELKQYVGKENVFDATRMMSDARTAGKVAKLANITKGDSHAVDELIKSSASSSNNMMDDLSFLQ